jgi:ABC-type lipoprotein export system ATPase subunit
VSEPARIEIRGVTKHYPALRPLRIADLTAGPADRLVLSGLDAGAAEVFINLITGASVPDEGQVLVGGRNTRDIATDTEWLASLDRFGIVTERSVLLEKLNVADNLALPLTLAIDPIPDEWRPRVEALADEVGLARPRLEAPASTLSPEERVRVHLGRALGPGPDMLLLEHPTARLDGGSAAAFGRTLQIVSGARGIGWIAVTDDEHFARAAGGRRLRLEAATGQLKPAGRWRWFGG